MIIADTSGLLALFNSNEPEHETARAVVESEPDPPIVSPYVVAEVDYLVATRLGTEAAITVLRELGSGAYHLATFDRDDLVRATDLIDSYLDQSIGVADASLVVLADRYRTHSLLTLDRRHFTVLRPLAGGSFNLLPATASP